jgi:hypothetical protein
MYRFLRHFGEFIKGEFINRRNSRRTMDIRSLYLPLLLGPVERIWLLLSDNP